MIQHLACIMDGNRRWATQQGKPTLYGHKQGVETVKLVAQFCLDRGIPHLSLYTFSLENNKRAVEEKSYLFNLICQAGLDAVDELCQQGIAVRFIGDRTLFPASVLPVCDQIEQQTAHGNRLRLNFLFFYGGRQEIVSGAKELARKVAAGLLTLDDITDESLRNHLWMADVPDPELIIRPGKVIRTSNFLMYESAYSEWVFPDCFWPALTTDHLEQALTHFAQCQRNLGR